MKRRSFWMLLWPLLSLAACAPTIPLREVSLQPEPAAIEFDATGKGWWHVYFHVAWDESRKADWHVDALLADQVMAPIVAHTEARLSLWRFHRRAAHDDSGHRFSFLFYADRDTAQTVNNGVRTSAMAKLLQEEGIVKYIGLAEVGDAPDPEIGATSDPAWPQTIQRGWPWFIMGVSQSWLRLISEVKASSPPPKPASLDELLEYYRRVNDEVSALWRTHGQHAYLHHLNALFGYQPLIIKETTLKKF